MSDLTRGEEGGTCRQEVYQAEKKGRRLSRQRDFDLDVRIIGGDTDGTDDEDLISWYTVPRILVRYPTRASRHAKPRTDR